MSNEEKKTQNAEWENESASGEQRGNSSSPDNSPLWDRDLEDEDSDELDDLGFQTWEEFQEDEDTDDSSSERVRRMRSQEEAGSRDALEGSADSADDEETESDSSDLEIDDRDSDQSDLDDRISMAMEKIVQDAMGSQDDADSGEERGEEKDFSETEQQEEQRAESPRRQNRSARPQQFSYVSLEDGEMELPEIRPVKKHKGLKITGIVAAMLVVTAGAAYAGASYYYADKFFEGTSINGIDCSGMTPYEAEQAIASQVENYSIQIASRNLDPQVIDGSTINYRYLSNGDILKLLKQQKPYEWIKGYFSPAAYSAAENITFDKQLLQSEILSLNCAKAENQVEPEDAYVAFKDTKFEIVPETEGSKLDIRSAYHLLDEAISGKQSSMDFVSTPEAYVQAAVTSEDPDLKATVDACNNFTNAKITYIFGDQTVTLDGMTIKDWLQFDEKGQFVRNDASFQQHIKEYVAQLASTYDTVGTNREFHTTSGRTVYVYGSAYGWKIDKDAEEAQLLQEIQSGAQVEREPVYSMTANSRGVNDLGNTYIEVDLSNQYMYYYQNGQIIFQSDIVSGLMSDSDRQTPPGIFTLYYKKSPDVLRGSQKPDGTYEYEQPVTYWMPFNGGIGFHDADWQPYFGGDRYLYGGSHGCINLPPSSAAVLYDLIQYGVPIVCFY